MTRGMLVGVMAAAAILAYPAESRAGGVRIGIAFDGGDYHRHESYRLGLDRGQDKGWNAGYEDGRHDRRFDYEHDRCYRFGTDGYRHSYGSREAYISGFQNGFESAYRRGFEAGRRRDRREDRHHRDWDHDGR